MLHLISQVYNEEKRIVKWLIPLLKGVHSAYIVDDGSIDGTRKAISEIHVERDNLWFYPEEHKGYDKYNMHLRSLAPELDWIIRLDVDEELDYVDLQKIAMTHIPKCEELGYDSIQVTMKDYIDDKFIRDQAKTRIFKNMNYIIHPEKIHTEEIGFKNTLIVPEIIINHRRTKKEVLEGTKELLKELKAGLDAFELTWHRTREAGFSKEFDKMLKDLSINVKI